MRWPLSAAAVALVLVSQAFVPAAPPAEDRAPRPSVVSFLGADDRSAPVPVKPSLVVEASAEILTAHFLGHESDPASDFLIVRAVGEFRTGGIKNARLVHRHERPDGRIMPSDDGYLELDFVADPPGRDAPTTPVYMRLNAAKIGPITVRPGMLRGVRVYGAMDWTVNTKITGLDPKLARP